MLKATRRAGSGNGSRRSDGAALGAGLCAARLLLVPGKRPTHPGAQLEHAFALTPRFSYPEARLGFTGGMIAGLAARIPHKVAMEVMLLGATLDARRAYEVGLVNRVVADGRQVDEAVAMARELAESAPLVLGTIKRFVAESILPKGPSELMGRATHELGAVRESEDAREGMRAAHEKRKPVYKGR